MKAKRVSRHGSLTFRWDTPPGATKGGVIERVVRGHVYERRIKPKSLLSPSEAALILEVRREFIYHLIWKKRLKAVTRDGRIMIAFRELSIYDKNRRRRGPVVRRAERG